MISAFRWPITHLMHDAVCPRLVAKCPPMRQKNLNREGAAEWLGGNAPSS
jgi:hypothetical protein